MFIILFLIYTTTVFIYMAMKQHLGHFLSSISDHYRYPPHTQNIL